MTIEPFFDAATSSLSYLGTENATQCCAVIHPVLDFEPASGEVTTHSADAMLEVVQSRALKLEWVLETHAHADHLTAAQHPRDATGAPVAVGEDIRKVRTLFDGVFNTPKNVLAVDMFFHRLLAGGDTIAVGDLMLSVRSTRGHTQACISYFCDYPSGQSGTYICVSELAEQLSKNGHLKDRNREEFIAFRFEHDWALAMPRPFYPYIQVNLRAGQFSASESNGQVYLKQPLALS